MIVGIIAADLAIIWRIFWNFFRDGTLNGSKGPSSAGLRAPQYQYREPYTPQRATFEGWKSEHSVRVMGRRISDAASDGSKAPLGIRKEVEYAIADARNGSGVGHPVERDGSSELYELGDTSRGRMHEDVHRIPRDE